MNCISVLFLCKIIVFWNSTYFQDFSEILRISIGKLDLKHGFVSYNTSVNGLFCACATVRNCNIGLIWKLQAHRWNSTIVPQVSRECPASVPRCPAGVPRVSRGCPASVPRCPAGVPRVSRECPAMSRDCPATAPRCPTTDSLGPLVKSRCMQYI